VGLHTAILFTFWGRCLTGAPHGLHGGGHRGCACGHKHLGHAVSWVLGSRRSCSHVLWCMHCRAFNHGQHRHAHGACSSAALSRVIDTTRAFQRVTWSARLCAFTSLSCMSWAPVYLTRSSNANHTKRTKQARSQGAQCTEEACKPKNVNGTCTSLGSCVSCLILILSKTQDGETLKDLRAWCVCCSALAAMRVPFASTLPAPCSPAAHVLRRFGRLWPLWRFQAASNACALTSSSCLRLLPCQASYSPNIRDSWSSDTTQCEPRLPRVAYGTSCMLGMYGPLCFAGLAVMAGTILTQEPQRTSAQMQEKPVLRRHKCVRTSRQK
jgi:hypothetical protein